MEELKHSKEIIELGKKLVKEFSSRDRQKITLSWMAHYLSELITLAESENDPDLKAAHQEKACEMIMRIWANRNDYPSGVRPLSGLASAVAVLSSLQEKVMNPELNYWQRGMQYEDSSPWGKFAKAIRTSTENLIPLAILSSFSHEALLSEKEWLKFPNLLSEDENKILGYIDQILDRDSEYYKFVIRRSDEDEEEPEKIDLIFNEMEKLLKQQQSSFEELRGKVLLEKNSEGLTETNEDEDDDIDNDYKDY